MHFREYLLNEYFFTHMTHDAHKDIDKDVEKPISNIDEILVKILTKVGKDKAIQILHKSNKLLNALHKNAGKKQQQYPLDDIHDISHSEYFEKEDNSDLHRRKFRLDINDFRTLKGNLEVKTFMEQLSRRIENMFKKLGYATLVKINADAELMVVQVFLSHHTKNLNLRSLLSLL